MSKPSRISASSVPHLSVIGRQAFYLNEALQLSTQIYPQWDSKSIQQQLEFFIKNFSETGRAKDSQTKKVQDLQRFFFQEQNFQLLEKQDQSLGRSLFLETLNTKKAPPSLLMMLFLALAESIQLKIKPIGEASHCLLKVYLDDQPQIIDFRKGGQFLSPLEIVDLVNEGVDFTNWCDGENLFIKYLNRVSEIAKKEFHLRGHATIQSYLMRHQPFNLKLLSERAKTAYQTGDYLGAAEDIRDYFLYKSPDFNNFQLKKIYKMALKKQKKRTSHHSKEAEA